MLLEVQIMGRTDENLKAAFAGESQARNKYTYYAKVAQNEGYHYIAKIFLETADNEMQHAKDEFKRLKLLKSTKDNLKEAIAGEHHETARMYPDFAAAAKKDGDPDAARLFTEIGDVEAQHESRYKKLLDMVEKGNVYRRDKPIRWKCSKCGYVHLGLEPPQECPSCKHSREFYEPECMCFADGCEVCS
jgi:rubrerythrin